MFITQARFLFVNIAGQNSKVFLGFRRVKCFILSFVNQLSV